MKSYAQLLNEENYKPSTNRGMRWKTDLFFDIFEDTLDLQFDDYSYAAFGKANGDVYFRDKFDENNPDYFAQYIMDHDKNTYIFYKNELGSYKAAQDEVEKHILQLEKFKNFNQVDNYLRSKGYKKSY